MNARSLVAVVLSVCALGVCPVQARDVHLPAAGPVGFAYVGLYYGLTDPATGSWYTGSDILGSPSTTWAVIADTASSACLLGKSTQDAYVAWDGIGLPMQPYPAVKFTDVGFGGTADFAVTGPLGVMVAGQKAGDPDPENHAVFHLVGPLGAPDPTQTVFAAARELLFGEDLGIDLDILGMSVMQGRVLRVDPHELGFARWLVLTMAGDLTDSPPPPDPRAVYIPLTMQGFFSDPQPVDVGEHPMLPIYLRKNAGDPFATRQAIFDTGSPACFISESFAVEAGIDLSAAPDLTIPVSGIGQVQVDRPGYLVDELALDLGNGREGDRLVISNLAVFVIPDAEMPGGLSAILGNNPFAPWMNEYLEFQDTSVVEWYLDTRDPDNAFLVVVIPEPGGLLILVLAAPALLRRARRGRA